MRLAGTWLASLLLPCLAMAAETSGTLQPTAWLGFSLLDFDYEEFFDNGISANREEGLIPGLTGGLSVKQGQWFAETGLRASIGTVDYHGPVESDTDEEIIDWNLLAGRELFRKDRASIGLFAGVGYHRWNRDIQSTATASGLFETYDWWYGMLGVRGEYRFSSAIQFRVDAYLTRTVNPEVEVEFEANFDDVTLPLGEKTGRRIILTLDRRLNNRMRVWVSPWYEFQELGRSPTRNLTSNGIITGTVFEPRSETKNYGIAIGFTMLLGDRK
jgi:hypothetical protein